MKIVSEAGVAQGVRRVEAVTGAGALEYLRKLEDELGRAGARLKAPLFEVSDKLDKALASAKALEKELDKLKAKLASGGGGRDLLAEAVDVGGVRLLATTLDVDDARCCARPATSCATSWARACWCSPAWPPTRSCWWRW
jgi:alanyl-tRNA synthetase